MAKAETLVKGEVFMRPVEMPLTERELLVYGDELASLDSELAAITQRHQAEKGQFKSETEAIASRSTTIFNRLRTKKEFKDVECYNDFNFFEGMCDIRRVDSNEVVSSRRMTVDEYKEELPFPQADEDADDDIA